MGLLHRGGAQLTPRAEDADILVVNTCSFIDSAKQESVDTILEMVQHKIANGGRAQRLIVAGCLVERYRDEIRANIPEVDAVVGTGELEAILEAAGLNRPTTASPFPILTTAQVEGMTLDRHASSVNQHSRPESNAPQLLHETTSRPEGDAREQSGRFSRDSWDGATAALPTYLYSDETPRILTTPRSSAYIKIAEGCDHPCSFCIIPQLRGKFRSRPLASIVAEAKSLISQGVREITLIGQDTTCYGEDLAPDAVTNKRPELADLLDALAPLTGLKWLRFLYAYPNKITSRLLQTIARHDNIANYLDVPLQHASANVLRRMKRGGTADRFLQIIATARKTIPNLVLRTSFIVGFPGETAADFDELCQFVQAARFDNMGVFLYSDEDSSRSYALDGKVDAPTKRSRQRRLMALQRKIARARNRALVGAEVPVLVEGLSAETDLLWEARLSTQAPEIDGVTLINDVEGAAPRPGEIRRLRITGSHDYDVLGTLLAPTEAAPVLPPPGLVHIEPLAVRL